MRNIIMGLAAIVMAMPTLAIASPPRNPFLADSVIPIFHNDTGQTGATAVPGPIDESRTIEQENIIWKKLGPSDGYSYQYSGLYPNGKRVGWFGGQQQLVKLDADTLETISTYSLHEGKFYSPEEIGRLIDKADKLSGQALYDAIVPPLAIGIERGAQAIYRLIDNENNLYVLYTDRSSGDQYIRKFGDAVVNDPNSDIVLKQQIKLPAESGRRMTAIAMNMTYDGTIIVVTLDGTLFAVSRDFRILDKAVLADRPTDGKEFMDAFVRNSIAIDDAGGIFVVTGTRMQRVQWTGTKLSFDERDGAWSVPYATGPRGSGTTPALVGWGKASDKLVVIGDGVGNAVLYWRDHIPDDWRGLSGQPRRVAAITPIRFGKDPIRLENALVTQDYGIFVANDTLETKIPWQGSQMKTTLAEKYAGQTSGNEIRGGMKWTWNPHTRSLDIAWKTPLALVASICTPNANHLLYCVGMRDGASTIEAIDWNNGKSVFHYVLGKSYRYTAVGGLVNIAPNGDIECGCAGGFGMFRVRTPPQARFQR
ncbi:hypothetical protein [Sphingobium tyrosinilyticum]|uniref:Uncharacterized protein n=1 Tax=Sphingobium tyrosinilyticum TaxID=2715436 RepID=A0ABV9EY51_9SPHN